MNTTVFSRHVSTLFFAIALLFVGACFHGGTPLFAKRPSRMERFNQHQERVKQQQQAKQAAPQEQASNGENLEDEMVERLRVFTQGPKALHSYATDDVSLMSKWKASYDEAKAELAKMNIVPGKYPRVDGEKRTLDRYLKTFEGVWKTFQKKHKPAGTVLFATSAMDPANPQGTTERFRAGDHIYALIQAPDTFKNIVGNDWIKIDITIDGKKIHTQFVRLHNPADAAGKAFIFEIAPDPAKMTAYANPDIEYGTTKANLRQGPQEMTMHLSNLAKGQHKIALTLAHYGKVYAKGSFSIEGNDFSFYKKINEQAGASMIDSATFPRAKMTNPDLQKEMRALLEKAGWSI